MKKVILASQSPRRQELLSKCGISFDIEAADIDETINLSKPIEDEIKRLSTEKAKFVYTQHTDCIVIGSDTMVTIHGKPLGKPKDRQDAHNMLVELSNNTHQVITGVCIYDKDGFDTQISISNVTFKKLSDTELNNYLDSDEPYDKAGAYAIQGKASCFITHIDGDYYSIMGLPVSLVYSMLKARNVIL